MKFLGSILVYAVMALVLGWGMLQAVRGNYWLLAIGFLSYMTLLTRIGCLPPKSH